MLEYMLEYSWSSNRRVTKIWTVLIDLGRDLNISCKHLFVEESNDRVSQKLISHISISNQ